MDVRLLDEEILSALEKIKVKDYHFAWDDPRENLEEQFRLFRDAGLTAAGQCKVYVLTNYWSTMKEDLFRIYTLRNLGFMPFVMIYDKHKFVDSKGRWLPDVDLRYSEKQLRDFKICQHMQRWCGRINIIKSCPDFEKYEPYRRWMEKGCPVPRKI